MFDKIDESLSVELFKALVSGKIINRRHVKDNLVKTNPLYIELSENEKTYMAIYKTLGYSLKVKADYYYLSSTTGDSSTDSLRTKVIMTMLALFRYVTHDKGYSVDYLMNDHYGINKDDINWLNNSKYMNGLKLAEGKNFIDVLLLLKDRNIIYSNLNGNYVLTEAGVDFFNEYIKSETPFQFDDVDT